MSSRKNMDFNTGWRFSKLPLGGILDSQSTIKKDFSDDKWEQVTLPHTWNDKDGVSGWTGVCEGGEHYYRGRTCYRKTVFVEKAEFLGRRIYMEFGAANTTAELYVNEQYAGRHEGGYSMFRFDITDFLLPDADNSFAVLVSNAPTDYIAPITDQGDFTKMGGLYRDVKLIAVNPLHIDLLDYGSSGVFITPKNINKNNADIDVFVKLANRTNEEKNVKVYAEILSAQGETLVSSEIQLSLNANDTTGAETTIKLSNPILWEGRKNPYIYSALIKVMSNGEIVDEYTQAFGIREYFIDREKGFFLNGKYLDLRGANYHQDSYENGWAMSDEQRERDYNIMCEMGCTAVRMAHYQHAAYEYDLCDRLGLCVWSEIGVINKMADSDDLHIAEGFEKNAANQLTELIRQNYNHPSIIVWGTSNELFQINDEIYEIYTRLNELANHEDPTRLKTFADNQFWGRFLKLPADVVGYNRYFGWYHDAGPVEKYGEWLDVYHNENEYRPICVSEYGGGAATSQYKDHIQWPDEIDPWGKRHYENYQTVLHEKIWAQFSTRRYLWGKFIWCMFDFASDGREEGDTVGQNDKGLVTRERMRKDSFYFYKSVWNSEPMVHLTEKRFNQRPADVPYIKAYSNAEACELFINGESQGRKLKNELPIGNETVYIWNDITLETERENEIVVKAEFSDESIKSDNAFIKGI